MLADRIVNELDSKAELFRDLAAFAEFLASLEDRRVAHGVETDGPSANRC
jgi:hypothetical protein